WVVSDKFFHRPAPTNEARYLGKLHPGERHRYHGGGGVLFSNAFSQSVELADVTPAAQERHPDMPAGGERAANARTGEKLVYRAIILPRCEHRQMAEAHPGR